MKVQILGAPDKEASRITFYLNDVPHIMPGSYVVMAFKHPNPNQIVAQCASLGEAFAKAEELRQADRNQFNAAENPGVQYELQATTFWAAVILQSEVEIVYSTSFALASYRNKLDEQAKIGKRISINYYSSFRHLKEKLTEAVQKICPDAIVTFETNKENEGVQLGCTFDTFVEGKDVRAVLTAVANILQDGEWMVLSQPKPVLAPRKSPAQRKPPIKKTPKGVKGKKK